MIYEVRNCNECPMMNNDIEDGCACNHPDAPVNDELSFTYFKDFPVWCPLKKEEIIIKLVQ